MWYIVLTRVKFRLHHPRIFRREITLKNDEAADLTPGPERQQEEELGGDFLRMLGRFARLALKCILPLELRPRGEKARVLFK